MAMANLSGLASQLEREGDGMTVTRLRLVEALAGRNSAKVAQLNALNNAELIALAREQSETGQAPWRQTEAARALAGLGELEGRFRRLYEAKQFRGTLNALDSLAQGPLGAWLSEEEKQAVRERCEVAMAAGGS